MRLPLAIIFYHIKSYASICRIIDKFLMMTKFPKNTHKMYFSMLQKAKNISKPATGIPSI